MKRNCVCMKGRGGGCRVCEGAVCVRVCVHEGAARREGEAEGRGSSHDFLHMQLFFLLLN